MGSGVVRVSRNALAAIPPSAVIASSGKFSSAAAHGGVGSISHIFCTYFQSLIGVRTVGVPFRGLSDSTQALLASQVDYSCNQAPLTVEHVRAGTLKAYAITSEQRSAMMPDLPTAAEAGLPAFMLGAWSAFQFPKGTPEAIVKKASAALSQALDEEETRQRFASLGIEIAPPGKRAPGLHPSSRARWPAGSRCWKRRWRSRNNADGTTSRPVRATARVP